MCNYQQVHTCVSKCNPLHMSKMQRLIIQRFIIKFVLQTQTQSASLPSHCHSFLQKAQGEQDVWGGVILHNSPPITLMSGLH